MLKCFKKYFSLKIGNATDASKCCQWKRYKRKQCGNALWCVMWIRKLIPDLMFCQRLTNPLYLCFLNFSIIQFDRALIENLGRSVSETKCAKRNSVRGRLHSVSFVYFNFTLVLKCKLGVTLNWECQVPKKDLSTLYCETTPLVLTVALTSALLFFPRRIVSNAKL